MVKGIEVIQNIQETGIFRSLKALLAGARIVANFTPTPIDNLVVDALVAVLTGLEQAGSKDEALQALANALPDDDADVLPA